VWEGIPEGGGGDAFDIDVKDERREEGRSSGGYMREGVEGTEAGVWDGSTLELIDRADSEPRRWSGGRGDWLL